MVATPPSANRRRLSAALRLVPGLAAGAVPLAMRPVSGGSVNQLWRVDTPAGRFALRLASGVAFAPGADRRRELLLHLTAADAGLAPAIRARNRRGDLVLDWVAGRSWQPLDFLDEARVAMLQGFLLRLQALSLPALPAFDPAGLAERYARAATRNAGNAVHEVERAARQLARLELPSVIVHGDLASGNLIGTRRLQAVDWEYAQLAHPACEYGALCALQPRAATLLAPWPALAPLPVAQRRQAVRAATRLYGALNRLWRLARLS